MSTVFSFQTQLVSIMDALSKTAVMEISKLVEIESKMLKIEITRGRNEIASLTEKLQLMEKLLYIAQGSRQEAAAAAAATCSGVRDNTEDEALEPERTRPAIKRLVHVSGCVCTVKNHDLWCQPHTDRCIYPKCIAFQRELMGKHNFLHCSGREGQFATR